MWFSFNRLYRGDIKRLVILAAPSGGGKSTFLDNSESMLDASRLPTELSDFHDLAKTHVTIRGLRSDRTPGFDDLCMHVDLSRPIRKLDRFASNRDQLLAKLTPRLYSEWNELAAYTQRAEEVHVLTMFVRRKTHCQRWMERAKQRKNVRKLSTALNLINSDLSNGSELHRAAYDAWRRFVASIDADSNHIVDADTDRYTFLSSAEFDREVDFGYQDEVTAASRRRVG